MFRRIIGAAAIALAATMPVVAQDTPANPVVATVNGKEITESDVAFAVSNLGAALQQIPEASRPQVVLDLMIDMEILAEAAEKSGLADDPIVAQRLDYYRTQTLRDLYMEKVISDQITDEAVKARYDKEVGDLEPAKEVSASHILVEDEETAKKLIAELNDGADFAKLAEENSKDPGSAARGGSLGFFGPGQMVAPFEEAAFALAVGEVTQEPVQSQFGWHVIKVDDTREQPVPSFEEVEDRVRQLMIREAFMNELNKLKETATIEKMTPQQ